MRKNKGRAQLAQQVIDTIEPLVDQLDYAVDTCLLTDAYCNSTRRSWQIDELITTAQENVSLLRRYIAILRGDELGLPPKE